MILKTKPGKGRTLHSEKRKDGGYNFLIKRKMTDEQMKSYKPTCMFLIENKKAVTHIGLSEEVVVQMYGHILKHKGKNKGEIFLTEDKIYQDEKTN